MENDKRAHFIVENFGPVRKGKIELKPLTVFIGSNNSGKSYIAQLIYALTQGLRGRVPGSVPHIELGTSQEAQIMRKELIELLKQKAREERQVHIRELPEAVKKLCMDWYKEIINRMPETLEEALRDYFGCENARELVRQDERRKTLKVCIRHPNVEPPFLEFRIRKTQRKSQIKWNLPDFLDFQISRYLYIEELEYAGLDGWIGFVMMDWWRGVLRDNGLIDRSAYYLPAARSGILQGWQLFASMFVEFSRRSVGLRRLEVPPFSGVAGDFLQVLWERLLLRPERLRSEGKFRSETILEVLEKQIFKGKVSLERGRKEGPLLFYESNNLKVPLHRASSMVAELAPLDLWLKGIIRPGDLLIIDEPEAHLHPSSQRAIARVLVRLVRVGVKVLVTTHSPLILQQLSNSIIASSLNEESKRKHRIEEPDILKQHEIGVYLFRLTNAGTQIVEVETEEGFGISEDDFVRVYDEIGEETYQISLEHQKNKTRTHANRN